MPRSTLRNALAPLPPAVLFALLLSLAGCGNKGPLYLPSSPEPHRAASIETPAAELSATPDNR